MKKVAAVIAIPLLAFPVLSPSGVAVSQSKQGETCGVIDNNTARLACYDVLFKGIRQKKVAATIPVAKPAPKTAKKSSGAIGAWKINAGKVALDGSPRVVMRVASDKPLVDQAGQERDAYVYAACRNEKVTLWVNFDQPLEVRPENVPVKVRFDNGSTETLQMQNSYDWRSVGIWEDRKAKKMLARLESASRLSVKVRNTLGRDISAQFNIAKLSEALVPLQDACGWTRQT